MSEDGSLDSLNYALEGTKENLESWGHQYIRSMAGEVASKYQELLQASQDPSYLDFLVDIIVPHSMKTHEEPEAIDLLLEVEQIEKIIKFGTENNYKRVCNYLKTCAQYAADQEEMMRIYKSAFEIYFNLGKYPDSLLVA